MRQQEGSGEVTVDTLFTFIPGVCYIRLLQSLPQEVLPGLSSLCLGLSFCLSVWFSACLLGGRIQFTSSVLILDPICLFVCLSVWFSACLLGGHIQFTSIVLILDPICLFVCLSVCLVFCLSVRWPCTGHLHCFYAGPYLFVCLAACLSVCLSACPSVWWPLRAVVSVLDPVCTVCSRVTACA